MPLDANQRVAANIRRLRLEQGWTQQEAAKRADPWLHRRYSKASWSALERSVDGDRVKRFDANEIEGLARTFGVDVEEMMREAEACPECGGTGWRTVSDVERFIKG